MANVACIEELKNAILDFDEDAAVTAAEKIIKEGVSPMDAIDAMGDALKVLGDKFQIMEVFLPEILLATDAFKAGLKVLEPELMKTIDAGSFQEKPKVVIGTVKGDVHAVGKDMVATMLTVGGFDVKDVGADVDSEVFITAAEEFGAQIIGLSALMSTTMPSQKEVIDFLEAKGLRNKYKVCLLYTSRIRRTAGTRPRTPKRCRLFRALFPRVRTPARHPVPPRCGKPREPAMPRPIRG